MMADSSVMVFLMLFEMFSVAFLNGITLFGMPLCIIFSSLNSGRNAQVLAGAPLEGERSVTQSF